MNRPRRKPGFRLEQLAEECVLYFPGESRILYCNQCASLIWQLCDGERTAAEIAAELAIAFPESAAQIQADVDETLAALASSGAIEFA